jgi:hypothetical protein
MEEMEMPGEIRIAMEGAKADLGAAQAPAGVDAGTEARIEGAVEESFVAGFRAVMLVSAGLVLTNALVAALLVADKRVTSARVAYRSYAPRPGRIWQWRLISRYGIMRRVRIGPSWSGKGESAARV